MKFLLAIYRYNPFGGLQRDTLRLIEELTGRGHEVIVFTTAWDGPGPRLSSFPPRNCVPTTPTC